MSIFLICYVFFSSTAVLSDILPNCFRIIDHRAMQMRAIVPQCRFDLFLLPRAVFLFLPFLHWAVASVDFSHVALRWKVRIAESGGTKCLFIHDVRVSQGERGLTHICRRPSDLRRWRYKRTRRPHYPLVVSLVQGFEIPNEKYLRGHVARQTQ